MSLWRQHPGVRSGDQLTLGERSADRLRNSMGSWGFVFGALGFLAIWMGINGKHGFDPYPFILLNLVLSCVAALQGAILLIAAKRADQIASELARHDHDILLGQNRELAALRTLTDALRERIEELAKAKSAADHEALTHLAAEADTLKTSISSLTDLVSSFNSGAVAGTSTQGETPTPDLGH